MHFMLFYIAAIVRTYIAMHTLCTAIRDIPVRIRMLQPAVKEEYKNEYKKQLAEVKSIGLLR